MTMTIIYRPPPLPASILDEIVCADEYQRFSACEAVCLSIWATGLSACQSSDERHRWRVKYAQLAARLVLSSKYETTPQP